MLKFISWLVIVLLFLAASVPMAMAGWKVIYTTKDTLKSGEALGYRPFKLIEGVQYAVLVKRAAGDIDIDVFLFNPGDRQVAEGTEKGDSNLLLFTPEITEAGYKIVLKSKKGEGKIRLTLAHQ